MPWRARLAMGLTQFVNRRGLYFGPRSTKVHVSLYRRSGGRVGGRFPGWPAAPILLLDHVGAKSGIKRTSPLMYHQEGERIAVVASKAGQPTNPAWFHNLRAHPDATVQIGPEVRDVRARVASDDERERLWPMLVAAYPGYEEFRRMAMAKGRELPVLLLEPQ